MSVKPSMKELKAILKPMTWKDRLEYLWTYYKIVLVAILGVAALISIVVGGIQKKQIQTLYSGIFVGVQLEQGDRDAVVKDLTELFEGDGKKQIVELSDVAYIPGDDPANLELNNAAAMKVTVMVAAKSLDYILTDKATYEELICHSPYQDLRSVLTEEQQKRLKNEFVWIESNEEMPGYPMALDISETEFVKKHVPYQKGVYLVFVGNTGNNSRDPAFIDYIFNWKE